MNSGPDVAWRLLEEVSRTEASQKPSRRVDLSTNAYSQRMNSQAIHASRVRAGGSVFASHTLIIYTSKSYLAD